jgi:hypothetical protein
VRLRAVERIGAALTFSALAVVGIPGSAIRWIVGVSHLSVLSSIYFARVNRLLFVLGLLFGISLHITNRSADLHIWMAGSWGRSGYRTDNIWLLAPLCEHGY